MAEMSYRYETNSFAGLVQQTVRYVGKGYRYYVVGEIPKRRQDNPEQIDAVLLHKFDIRKSSHQRAREKKSGRASLQYLRYKSFWIIFATPGRHRFFEEHTKGNDCRYSDIRSTSIRLGPYAVSSVPNGQKKPGELNRYRVRVSINKKHYKEHRAFFAEKAAHWSAEKLGAEFTALGEQYFPYKPVRGQLLKLVRRVNNVRNNMGYEKVPYSVLNMAPVVKSVKVFADDLGRAA